jgi:ABC-type Fe2+-enterobactin transport system substrate-binding protein
MQSTISDKERNPSPMTREVVIISQATQKIVQLAEDFETSSMELLDQFQRDLSQMYRATLAKMEAIIREDPELLILEGVNSESANELTRN